MERVVEPAPAVIEGRYELLELIGTGGTGRVFRARDRVLDRVVAIKLLRPGHDEVTRQRLHLEAQIAVKLASPGIARVYDWGEQAQPGVPEPYVVMEYVAGTTLRDVLRRGPLPPRDVAVIVAKVAEALAHIHAAGVVHRDVKPGNVMLADDGRVVLLDFGIARQADSDPLTATGLVVGTVDFISPEQAAGQSATARSDLYSLGLVAYEALTGERPLTGETQIATLVTHATTDVPPLPATVPLGLRRLIEQMVRREPARRPSGAAVVALRAHELAADLDATDTSQLRTPLRVSRRSMAAAAALVVLATTAVLTLAMHGRDADGAAAAAVATPASSTSSAKQPVRRATQRPSTAPSTTQTAHAAAADHHVEVTAQTAPRSGPARHPGHGKPARPAHGHAKHGGPPHGPAHGPGHPHGHGHGAAPGPGHAKPHH